MGNSQIKDGGEGSRQDGAYGGYPETRTTPGPSGFAPDLRVGDRTGYATGGGGGAEGGGTAGFSGAAGGMGGGMGRAGGAGGAVGGRGGIPGDVMDVESKADDGEEEEVRHSDIQIVQQQDYR